MVIHSFGTNRTRVGRGLQGLQGGNTWTWVAPDLMGFLHPAVPAILQKTRGPMRDWEMSRCPPTRCISVCRSPIASAFLIDLAFLS